MYNKDYDFAGWVTKHDIVCSDGAVIKHDAFRGNDGAKVPLVWNHDYSDVDNVIGNIVLKHMQEGVYGYGYLNDTDKGKSAKIQIQHGDITAMSIGARKLKRMGQTITHGQIYEVSLVLAGANPGAFIDNIIAHSEDGGELNTEKTIIYSDDMVIHSADSLPQDEEELGLNTDEEILYDEEGEDLQHADEQTVGEIINGMTQIQRNAVEVLLGSVVDKYESGDDEDMKHNVFKGNDEEVLTHADADVIFADAKKLGSLKEATVQHGITNIEILFPEAKNLNPAPHIHRDNDTGAQAIVAATRKSPFSRIRTTWADFTTEEARARGYIKGKEKVEQVFAVAKRETLPQTIYKKQKLDRDDIIDITDFDVVAYINNEMRFMLVEELGRAILVGDGRLVGSDDKIKEDKIRPVISDDAFYTLKKTYVDAGGFTEAVIKGMADYKGTGGPVMYIDPALLADVKLLKGTDGRWLSGRIPTDAELAQQFGVSRIQGTTLMKDKGALVVNLSDYTVGSTKGGEVTTFDDFDIDFNQYKYLIETRLSGALTLPHSAIHFAKAVDPEPEV